jgi:signal transduction histidine kinase
VNNQPQHHLLELIHTLTAAQSERDIEQRWRDTLSNLFDNAQFTLRESPVNRCQLGQNGRELLVPTFDNLQHYVLTADALDTNHEYFVDSLLKLGRHFCSIQDAQERGAAEERRRIARDLHDDVAARLLTLIHQLKEQRDIDLTRSLLKSLRNAIYTLDTKTNTLITHALTDIRAELQDRLNAIGMQLLWSQAADLGDLTFTPRQHINLQRMLHEVTTNVIRHANAHFINISIDLEDNQLHILACDDGTGFDIAGCVPGKGINNIRTRVEELYGQVDWQINHGCCIDIRFPVSTYPNVNTSEKN